MIIRSSTRVCTLLDAYPDVESLLAWYEVAVDDEDLLMTLAELARTYELDLDDLMVEIHAAVDDDEDDADDDQDFWDDLDDEDWEDDDLLTSERQAS